MENSETTLSDFLKFLERCELCRLSWFLTLPPHLAQCSLPTQWNTWNAVELIA